RDAAAAASRPDIAVGSPGRLLDLARRGHLRTDQLRIVMLDDCDQLLLRDEAVQALLLAPPDRQMRQQCLELMQNPHELCLSDEAQLAPHSLLQYRVPIADCGYRAKNARLLKLQSYLSIPRASATSLEKFLKSRGLSALAAHGDLCQASRMENYRLFRNCKRRILISTDLYAFGLQFQRVGVVINYCLPADPGLYLYRIGRAAHFGSRGLALTLQEPDSEAHVLNEAESRFCMQIAHLPATVHVCDYLPPAAGGDAQPRTGVIFFAVEPESGC
uniref:Helicase C-terminal domain-containing protein n=1 Tax=Macrostomum lignano TaxID=282301 RepID=A0A1I8GSZ1_9PLAT